MTTFQDPPPQSRRAVRQSERGETPQQPPAAQQPAEAQPATPYTFDPASGAVPPAEPAAAPQTGRRAQQGRVPAPADAQASQPLASSPPPAMPGETPEQAAYRTRDFSPESRRSADPSPIAGFDAPAAPPAFDSVYQTQSGLHSAGGSLTLDDTLNHTLSRRELREMRAAAESHAPPLQAPSDQRPEPIDALLNSGPIDIPTLAPPPGQSQALAEAMAEFDLLTRSRREAEARARDAQVASLATPVVPQAGNAHHASHASAAPVDAAPVDAAPADVAAAPAAPVAPAPQSTPSVPAPPPVQQLPFQQESVPQAPEPVASVPVASVPVASVPVASVPVAPQPVVAQPSVPSPPAAVEEPTAPPVMSAPVAPAPVVQQSIAYPPTASLPTTPPVASAPQQSAPAPMLAPPSFDAQPASPSNPPTGQQDSHGGRSPRAAGHWAVQAATEDELPYENTLSRTVGPGTSAITTSALVLPSVPQPDLILNSLTSTGEIIVTGTIDLPRSLGATGAHPSRVDNSDFEDDPLDSQVAAPDSAPIRAIRAISTNTSTRGVIEAKRPQGNRMLTAVIAVASVLCVGLVGLLVFAFATGKL